MFGNGQLFSQMFDHPHKQTKACKLPPNSSLEAGRASDGAQEGGDCCGEADGPQWVPNDLL